MKHIFQTESLSFYISYTESLSFYIVIQSHSVLTILKQKVAACIESNLSQIAPSQKLLNISLSGRKVSLLRYKQPQRRQILNRLCVLALTQRTVTTAKTPETRDQRTGMKNYQNEVGNPLVADRYRYVQNLYQISLIIKYI